MKKVLFGLHNDMDNAHGLKKVGTYNPISLTETELASWIRTCIYMNRRCLDAEESWRDAKCLLVR